MAEQSLILSTASDMLHILCLFSVLFGKCGRHFNLSLLIRSHLCKWWWRFGSNSCAASAMGNPTFWTCGAAHTRVNRLSSFQAASPQNNQVKARLVASLLVCWPRDDLTANLTLFVNAWHFIANEQGHKNWRRPVWLHRTCTLCKYNYCFYFHPIDTLTQLISD